MNADAQLEAALAEARNAYQVALSVHPTPRRAIANAWSDFAERIRGADDKQAVAVRACAVLRAFNGMSPQHRVLLATAEQPFTFPVDAAVAEAKAEEAWNAYPVLAEYRAEVLAARDAKHAMIEAVAAREREQAAREAPGRFLEKMRGRGLHFGLAAGNITLPPGEADMLTAAEKTALAEFKTGIVAILKAEAAAAVPVAVA